MNGKAKVQRAKPGTFAKWSGQLGAWVILRPVGTGSYAHLGQGRTAALAWADAATDC